MKTQLFPDYCGEYVSNMWCPLTDLETYIIVLSASVFLTGILYLIMRTNGLRNKEIEK